MSTGHDDYFKIGEKGHSILGGQGRGRECEKVLCFYVSFTVRVYVDGNDR